MDRKTIFGIIAAILAAIGGLLGLQLTGGGDDLLGGSEPPIVIPPTGGEPEIWYDIYFTNPTCPPVEERSGGVDEIIAQDIAQASVRVDIAAFDLESDPIIDALIGLEERGIIVRVVVDNEHTPEATINRLRRNGISVVVDDRSALMHNKFIIIDGRYLWTGSMNFSSNGVYCNNNNVVRIEAPRLVSNYTTEMDEMYNDRQFGARSPENTSARLTIGGAAVENYFAAEAELSPVIGRVIARADEEVLFMAFSFTSDEIGAQVLERAEAGIPVRGVFEASGAGSRYSYFRDLDNSTLPNINVRRDGNGRVMHHKVFIIDRKTVILGSYNFTDSADDTNDENLLVITDAEFASYFIEEFDLVWQEARDE